MGVTRKLAPRPQARSSSLWVLLGTPVVRPKSVETTAMGAAYLAGLAVGYWESRDDITRNWAVDTTFKSARPSAEMRTLRSGWERALERAKSWESPG